MEGKPAAPGEPSPSKAHRSHISGLSLRERKDVLVVAIEEQKKHMQEFDQQALASQNAHISEHRVSRPENDLFQIMQSTLEKVRSFASLFSDCAAHKPFLSWRFRSDEN